MLINKKKYHVNEGEFKQIPHEEYNHLKILDKLGEYERIAGLMNEISSELSIHTCIFQNPTHGAFLPIQCSTPFQTILLLNVSEEQRENIVKNIDHHKTPNVVFVDENQNADIEIQKEECILFCENIGDLDIDFIDFFRPFLITKMKQGLENIYNEENKYHLKNSEYCLYVPDSFSERCKDAFVFFLKEESKKELSYDNLIHLCIMVKNAGPQFETMLQENKKWIDRWTILDTGSTDGTVETIQRVMADKKGELFQEPFINFKESRNRCLELAGEKCKFTIMLDDTYIVKGDLRAFLNTIRGDQFADSLSIFIETKDLRYASNRIVKTASHMRYMYRIHEVITEKNNINVIIPYKDASVEDAHFDYMEERTRERKKLDIQFLNEELEENPMEPRTYYYLGQTYSLLGNYELAYQFFLKRAEFINSGFIQERIDALFEAARLANFQLKKPWGECLDLYERSFKADESRPDSLYFIGIHYYTEEGNRRKAFPYFKRAFELGFPTHCQYSLKPSLSFHFVPKFLSRICYDLAEYELGLTVSQYFLKMNPTTADDYAEVLSWYHIYVKLNMYHGPCVPKEKEKEKESENPIFCFVADGGFEPWTGRTILTKGVGGSETYIIEMARYIQRSEKYQVIVFCNCLEEDVFEGVIYKPLQTYYEFVNTNVIEHCIVSRFSEYLPVTFKGWTENVYLVVHDLTPSGIVIPMDKKLKQVFCLTEWHVDYMVQVFPDLKSITVPFYYGIDFQRFSNQENRQKVPYSFIYSSFPNRGLLVLLQMWPSIVKLQPEASLHIYCDVDGKWVNNTCGEQMKIIKTLLQHYKNNPEFHVYYYGWVDKQTLADAWSTADIWFYPCTFMETFCLTALEAALTKTLVITNHLAALKNTVGDRGIVVCGDPYTKEWKETVMKKIEETWQPDFVKEKEKETYIAKNYEWAMNLSWENQAEKLLTQYITPQSKFQYKGLYSVLHDKKYSSETLADVIHYFNKDYKREGGFEPIRILEIGTYTGMTLIQLILAVKHSIGVGIDSWENKVLSRKKIYQWMEENGVERSFYKNIYAADLQKRIKGIKGDSTHLLTNMIKRGEKYDLIYVDGSEKEEEFFTDLLLSWQIVNRGGYIVTKMNKNQSKIQTLGLFMNKYKKEVEYKQTDQIVFLYKK